MFFDLTLPLNPILNFLQIKEFFNENYLLRTLMLYSSSKR